MYLFGGNRDTANMVWTLAINCPAQTNRPRLAPTHFQPISISPSQPCQLIINNCVYLLYKSYNRIRKEEREICTTDDGFLRTSGNELKIKVEGEHSPGYVHETCRIIHRLDRVYLRLHSTDAHKVSHPFNRNLLISNSATFEVDQEVQ